MISEVPEINNSISGKVWNDINKNRSQDVGESGKSIFVFMSTKMIILYLMKEN